MKKNKHIGKWESRLSKQADNPREVAFAKQWQKENEDGHVLQHLIGDDFTDRDAMVAATVAQWLGSNIGMSFIQEAAKREPQIKKWLTP